MDKIKIKLAKLGYIPFSIHEKKLVSWKSHLFEIDENIETCNFQLDSLRDFWGYSDLTLEEELPVNGEFDFMLVITNVPLEKDYYARRLSNNRIVISLMEISDILRTENIKLENYIIRNIYRYFFVYLMYGKRIPLMSENTNFTHFDTRGCIFDFNHNKKELIYSLDRPIICEECKDKLNGNVQEVVPVEIVHQAEREIRIIKKGAFVSVLEFVKYRPVVSLLITFTAGVFMSIIAAVIYDMVKFYFF